MRDEKFMSVKLMLEQVFADGAVANTTRKMLLGGSRRMGLEERMKRSGESERVAEMSLSSLLYYVLVGDGRRADEFA